MATLIYRNTLLNTSKVYLNYMFLGKLNKWRSFNAGTMPMLDQGISDHFILLVYLPGYHQQG